MQRLINFLIFTTLLSSVISAQDKHSMTIDDLWNMKRINSFSLSQQNDQIALSVLTYDMDQNRGNSDIWITDVNGKNIRLLRSSEISEAEPLFSADGKKLIYTKEGQLWNCNPDGSEEKQLTEIYSGVAGVELSSDGHDFLFKSSVYPYCLTQECNKAKDKTRKENEVKAEIFDELMYRHWDNWRGEKRSHLFFFNLLTQKYNDLILGSKFDVPPIALGSSDDYSISPDKKEVVFTMNTSDFLATSTNNDIFTIRLSDVKDNFKTPYKLISTSKGNDCQPKYSPDGKYIAFTSMERAGFEADKKRLVLYDRLKEFEKFIPLSKDLSVGEFIWSNDSKYIYFISENEIYNSIFKLELNSGKLSTVLEKGVCSSIKLNSKGDKIYFLLQKSTMPCEIFSIKTDGTDLRQITKINSDLLAEIEMNDVETFWCEGAEGTKVQSILVKPPFFDETKKYPLIFLIHGGPQGHWEDDFHFRWNLQMFAARGYVVVAPNPRGSTGYGQKFTDEISRDWGGKVYTDLMNTYDFAIANYNFIDSTNTFAAGASYGGYMINWIEGHSNKFKALVCHDGVFNLESMYGTTEELWFNEWENGGAPWENRQLYQKWSPHMFVENFKTPMLIVHGAYDFRVPFSQAMELFTSLQKVGVESKLLYFPDETHFVTKPQNARLWWETIYDWFNNHIERY